MASQVVALTAPQAQHLYPKIEPILTPVLAIEGTYLAVDVLAAHIRGEMTIWVSINNDDIEAVMVTAIVRHPRKAFCLIPWIAGKNLWGWAKQFDDLSMKYAKDAGCSAMRGALREGWVRVAGYTKFGAILHKDI